MFIRVPNTHLSIALRLDWRFIKKFTTYGYFFPTVSIGLLSRGQSYTPDNKVISGALWRVLSYKLTQTSGGVWTVILTVSVLVTETISAPQPDFEKKENSSIDTLTDDFPSGTDLSFLHQQHLSYLSDPNKKVEIDD